MNIFVAFDEWFFQIEKEGYNKYSACRHIAAWYLQAVNAPTFNEQVLPEAAGIPMAILGNELVNSPNTIDDETHSFLNSIASDEEWKQNYYTGEWDSVKWNFGGINVG